MKTIFSFLLLLFCFHGSTQSFITRNIKSFGAKGDGKTNDHDAFVRAADFFNKRGGNGKLVISKGKYLVGKQKSNGRQKDKPLLEGIDLLHLSNISNFEVEGKDAPVIFYKPFLQFGTFEPSTGDSSKNGRNFYQINYAAIIGNAIVISNCTNISLRGLELNGNNDMLKLGGTYDAVGRQLPHSGIVIENSTKLSIKNVKAHHFALDGIMITNATGNSEIKDEIFLSDCLFEHNARQGLSWVGGNDLTVTRCGFNHTGKGKFYSPPGAGVDIEAEVGPVKNGKFFQCEFVNNTGCGLVADSGPSSNCTFTNCIFWGTTNWSVWVKKPSFTFIESKFYGSIIYGFDATKDAESTTFRSCLFEDKPYNATEPYGDFLIVENYARRMRFENCTMLAHKKKVAWFGWSADWKPEEKYQLINCKMEYSGDNQKENDWVGIFRNVRFINTTVAATNPLAEKKKYWWNGVDEGSNLLKGNNNRLSIGKKIEKF